MICKFCGLNNNDDAAFCSRCGSSLKENGQSSFASNSDFNAIDDDKKTMRMDKSANGNFMNLGAGKCQCGYPILPGMQVCPSCRTPLNGQGRNPVVSSDGSKKTVVVSRQNQPVVQVEEPINRRTVPDQETLAKATVAYAASNITDSSAKSTERFVASEQADSSAKKTERFVAPDLAGLSAKRTERFVAPMQTDGNISKKTVNIYQHPQSQPEPEPEPVVLPRFTLELVRRENETNKDLDKKTFEAASVVLNRQNTEPDNNSITSKQQAVISFEDGKWYIEDKSSFHTTFIRVTKKTMLEDGDILVLGNREFKFSKQ